MTRRPWTLVLVGLAVALLLAGFVSGYASSAPDGLERVATDRGFADTAEESPLAGLPLADYAVRGIDDPQLAGGVAGVVGVLLTVLVGGALFGGLAALGRRRRDDAPARPEGVPTRGRP